MKKPKYKYLFLLILLNTLLSSCMKLDVNLKIDNDLKPKLSGSIYIVKSLLNKEESTHNFLGKLFPFITFKEKKEETKIIDNLSYSGFKFKLQESNIKNKLIVKKENKQIHLHIPSNIFTNIAKELNVKILPNKISLKDLEKYGVVAKLTIFMPNKITKSNTGIVDGKKLTINLLANTFVDIDVYCNDKNNNLIPLLIILFLFFTPFFVKKQKYWYKNHKL